VKHLDLLNEFRETMAALSAEVEASSAMQLYDIHKVSENLILGVFRELLSLRGLRNLNAAEKVNFPGIDLLDDQSRVAIQVTATASLGKVKETLEMMLKHRLDDRCDRLIVYVLTRKQASYSQSSIDSATQGRITFRESEDILDFRDVCAVAANAEPGRVLAALEVVRAYRRGGVARGLSPEDFDPPASPLERATLNLIGVYFPATLYVGDIRTDVADAGDRRTRSQRKRVREALSAMGLRAPSDYEVNANQIIAFHCLEDTKGPFAKIVDLGTVTPLKPREFFRADEDRERVFKSLLRFSLQQKLYKHRVQWMHDEGLFVFLPRVDGDLVREEEWFGERTSHRRVYERKLNKNDPTKTFICKHFAFSVDFLVNADAWYAAIVPNWYFSYGDDYRRSKFADAALAWLKRREMNRTVFDHFRFLTSWLGALDSEDLFSVAAAAPSITFAETVVLENHPNLDDEAWLPLRNVSADDEEPGSIRELFDSI